MQRKQRKLKKKSLQKPVVDQFTYIAKNKASLRSSRPTPIFKKNKNHGSAPCLMRRSQQIAGNLVVENNCNNQTNCSNEYGLMESKGKKAQLLKVYNSKNTDSLSVDRLINSAKRLNLPQSEQKNQNCLPIKNPYRNRFFKNSMKESFSTDHTHRCHESPSNHLQIEIEDLNRMIKSLSKQADQYREKYEKSCARLEDIEREATAEKQKTQRLKTIYRKRINQLSQNQQMGKVNLGHIYSYNQFPKDIVPQSIIVQNSIDCSSTNNEGQSLSQSVSNISNLSLESH